MKTQNNLFRTLTRGSATWIARFLAIAAILILGRANQAAAARVDLEKGNTKALKHHPADRQVSYVQVGDVDQDDPNPPRLE